MSWCDDNSRSFPHINERALDLILLEELRCSEHFRHRFLPPILQVLGVEVEVGRGAVYCSLERTGDTAGETDILIEMLLNVTPVRQKCGVLIENKLIAPFSDRVKTGLGQAKRYLRERDAKIASGEWAAGAVVLVAPQVYLNAASTRDFDLTFSYEDVLDWLIRPGVDGELSTRLDHKRQMISAALRGGGRSGDRTADPRVVQLWDLYEHTAIEFPDLLMRRTRGEPTDSYSVPFEWIKESPGPAKCSAYHVLERGNVDILIGG